MSKKNKDQDVDLEQQDEDQAQLEANAEADAAEAKIRESFDASISAEQDDDEVKLNMIGAGATFKNATRLYNKFMIDAGLAISKADRNQIVEDTLEGRDFDTEEGFDAATAAIVDAVQGATERSGASLVRAYAKKAGMECFAKAKGDGAPRITFRSTFYNWIVSNPDATAEEAKAYIMGEGEYGPTSENIQRHASSHLNVFAMTRRLVAKVRGVEA